MIPRCNWLRTISPRSIGGKFRLAMSLAVIFLIVTLSILSYFFLEKLFLTEIKNKARSVTQVLAHSSVNGILAEDFLVVQELIDTMAGQRDVWDAIIFDKDGRIFTMHQPSATNEKDAFRFLPPSRPDLKAVQFIDHVYSSRAVLVTVVPIFAPLPVAGQFQSLGTAMVVFYLDAVYENSRMARQAILGIGILAILISWLVATRLAISITRPLRRLIDGVRQVASGDLNHQIEISAASAAPANEVHELGVTFNRMSASLKKLIDEKIEKENFALLGEFAGFVVHHLKSPLHGIRLAVENIRLDLADFPQFESLQQTDHEATQIIQSIKQLENFIKDTLDLAKPLTLQMVEADLNQIVNEVAHDFQKFGANIHLQLAPKVLSARLDVERFKMALANLLANAVDAVSHSKGPVIQVETSNGATINLKVTDNGIGMTEEVISRIFNPFYTTKGKGNGLGLTIVKKIVEAHGGQIQVSSRQHTGTSFNILLPPINNPQKLFME